MPRIRSSLPIASQNSASVADQRHRHRACRTAEEGRSPDVEDEVDEDEHRREDRRVEGFPIADDDREDRNLEAQERALEDEVAARVSLLGRGEDALVAGHDTIGLVDKAVGQSDKRAIERDCACQPVIALV